MAAAASADEGMKIKPPPRKRKTKKVIPVGRNGLKKRRVEKSRTSFDEKGYMGGFSFLFLFGWLVGSSCGFHVRVGHSPFSFAFRSYVILIVVFHFYSHRRLLLIRIRFRRRRATINTKKQNDNFQIRQETNLEETENGRIPS
jgi:hypothetical protein